MSSLAVQGDRLSCRDNPHAYPIPVEVAETALLRNARFASVGEGLQSVPGSEEDPDRYPVEHESEHGSHDCQSRPDQLGSDLKTQQNREADRKDGEGNGEAANHIAESANWPCSEAPEWIRFGTPPRGA